MSFIMKKKNRNILYAVVLVAVIGGGLFMFYGEEMIGHATGLFTFDNEDGIAGQCFVDASLGAYDADGNAISIKTLQSGYYIGGVEIAKIQFDISLTISGTDVDWDTLDTSHVDLVIYPGGGEPIHTGDDLLTKDLWSELSDNQKTGESIFTIWDADFAPDVPVYNWYLADVLGNPAKTLEDGTDIFLLQMILELEMVVTDLKGQMISSGVDIVGTWEINTLPDGTFDIIVNTGAGAIDDGNLDPVIIEKVEPVIDITKDTNIVVDDDVQPDVIVIPRDSTLAM